ncbi:hypothetical protein [Aporhodopirellula aestuarii]|uniref:Uncharacterized protein n=1 Tax=Aporhodopirellula aestuarii TaxID=2950107 RepID=A0ABT0UE86_9BACT|nr:hypothetical protein [Aporhodopirellula aestuarii]MCM2375225.1 hypothetical protein [Aporhodopirellula aestuarii]
MDAIPSRSIRFHCASKMIPPHSFDPIRSLITQAASTSPEQRVLAGLEHSELAIRVVEDGIRDQNPRADDATIMRLLAARIELMDRIQDRTLAKK